MVEPPGSRSDYQINKELLHEGNRVICRAVRCSDRKPLLLKVRLDQSGDALLEREYRLLQEIDADWVLPTLGLRSIDGITTLVFDDVGGHFLSSQIMAGAMLLPDFLDLAISITECLAQLHNAGIVHRGIQPACLYIDPFSSTTRLAGFEYATRVPRSSQRIAPHRISDGSLAYLAPEQTGRMNRQVDTRTDLYSTGVVLYRLLTGLLPFRSENPLELVHAHIARQAEPPHAHRPDIPPAVSVLVLKLLAKSAEDRYRSASGLAADLRRCRDELLRLGQIREFPLGDDDPAEQLEVAERLYGREDAIEQLLAAFERIRSGGVELLTVSGYSGIGKTSLVQEVQKPILQARGYFAAGKFDQLNRDEPYSALIQAISDLVRQLLTENDDAISNWRDCIAAALGSNVRVIVDVVPELELITGPHPPVAELGPMESRNRLELQFQHLINALARRDHPLVLFLDDLQWADGASLNLMVSLLAHGKLEGFLLIGAYRDNEVDARHPLMLALGDLAKLGAKLSDCRLGPLQTSHVEVMLANTLGKPQEDVRSLAALVQDKTLGNPFFARTFLETAFANGLIHHAHGEGWCWDTEKIRRSQPTDNVVELLATRIDQLPPDSGAMLKLAACVGNVFDVTTLATVCETSIDAVQETLRPPLRQGLIVARRGGRYAFYHDRIQEAAYVRVPLDERPPLHYRIAILLLRKKPGKLTGKRLFEVTDQINQALNLVQTDAERRRFAELNLQAGNRARRSAAFLAALHYYDHGIEAIGAASWSGNYELAFALYIGRAEVAFLCGKKDTAAADTRLLLEQARSDLERGEIYALEMIQYETSGRFADAVTAGKSALSLFGIRFPAGPRSAEQAINATMSEVQQHMAETPIRALLDMPDMKQADTRMSMRLLMTLWPSAYISGDKVLTVLIATRMVALSLRHGNAPESAYGYVTYAIALGAMFRDYSGAYAFGRLALDVNRRFDDLSSRSKVNHMFSCYIGFWSRPIAESFVYSREAYSAGLESGDFVYAAYGCFHESWHALFRGMNLRQYQREYGEKLGFLEQAGNRSFYDAHQLMLHWGMSLQGQTKEAGALSGDAFDEPSYLRDYRQVDFFIAFHHIAKLTLLYTFGDFSGARSMIRKAENVALGVRGMIWDAWLCFYGGLALTVQDHGRPLSDEEQQQLNERIERMGLWARSSPQNFSHQHYLLQAEQAFMQHRVADAIEAYEAAIAGAVEAGFIHDQALAKERYGEFWLERNNSRLARFYLTDALADYEHWGATAKVRQLTQRRGEVIGNTAQHWSSQQTRNTDTLDVATIIGSTRTLSEEVDAGSLVATLLSLLTQTSGAQRAILFGGDEDNHDPTLEVRVDNDGLTVQSPAADNWQKQVAEKAINYVRHTRQSLLVDNATLDERLAADPYVRHNQTLSIICVPLLNQTKLEGLVYLENNLVADAFTPASLELVEVIATQAAISLKNARLFQGMQREIKQREMAEQRIREVAEGTAAAIGEHFFEQLALHLSRAMNVRIAFVTECLDADKRRVRALAFVDNGKFVDGVEYELEGTPCKDVIDGSMCFFPDHLEQRFPKETGLTSYLGIPMYGADGTVVGHLAVVDDKPMDENIDDQSMMRIFSIRASAELERQRSQIESERLQRVLSERERLASLGEFAAMITHELRSPLSTIAMALDYAQHDSPSEKSAKRIELATTESERLQSLLNEILLFAKPHLLNRAHVDLDVLISTSIESLHQGALSENRQIRYWCRVDTPCAYGDEDKLKQVVINLISNACQAVNPDEFVTVELIDGSEQGTINVDIRNPGHIPEEILAKLTEPFFTTKSRGTGLGLAIVKRIVEAHDGQFQIRSDPTEGVCASVTLPIGN